MHASDKRVPVSTIGHSGTARCACSGPYRMSVTRCVWANPPPLVIRTRYTPLGKPAPSRATSWRAAATGPSRTTADLAAEHVVEHEADVGGLRHGEANRSPAAERVRIRRREREPVRHARCGLARDGHAHGIYGGVEDDLGRGARPSGALEATITAPSTPVNIGGSPEMSPDRPHAQSLSVAFSRTSRSHQRR